MRASFLLFLTLAAACGPYATSKPTNDPSGRGDDAYLLTCDTLEACQSHAASRCPSGYSVVGSGAHDGRTPLTDALDVVDVVTGTRNPKGNRGPTKMQMMISCGSPEPARTTVVVREASPPTGAVGFLLDAPLRDAKGVCEGAGHTWTEGNGRARCSGIPGDIGVEGYVTVTERAGAVGGLTVVVPLAKNEGSPWHATFTRLRRQLATRYGEPRARDTRQLADCERDMARCLDAPGSRIALGWSFRDGRTVTLSAQADAPRPPVILVTYAAAAERNPERSSGL